jgi:hypothetical protein
MLQNLEVRRWNPASDETEWIVIEGTNPRDGWPSYIARLPYAHHDRAVLFAAAPELLAALEGLVEAVNDEGECKVCGAEAKSFFVNVKHLPECALGQARAAIAKARQGGG